MIDLEKEKEKEKTHENSRDISPGGPEVSSASAAVHSVNWRAVFGFGRAVGVRRLPAGASDPERQGAVDDQEPAAE
jgi:hypothetical protein